MSYTPPATTALDFDFITYSPPATTALGFDFAFEPSTEPPSTEPIAGFGFDLTLGRAQFNEPVYYVGSTQRIEISDGEIKFIDSEGTVVGTLSAASFSTST